MDQDGDDEFTKYRSDEEMSQTFVGTNDSQNVLDERRLSKLMYQTSNLSIGFKN